MKKGGIIILAFGAVTVLAGVAIGGLVHQTAGTAVLLIGSWLMAWTLGKMFGEVANKEIEELKEKTRKLDEEYAALRDKEDR